MSERFPMDMITITKLITMPVIIRIVTVLDVTSLSILELLEYGLSLKDINYSIENRVISFDKPIKQLNSEKFSALGIPIMGDYYYDLFSQINILLLVNARNHDMIYRIYASTNN
jgi:hypothetical protein